MAIPKRKNVSSKSGITKYGSNARFADPVNHKYPLNTPAHIRAAESYFGNPKNRDKYPASARKLIQGRINSAMQRLQRKEGHSSPGRPS